MGLEWIGKALNRARVLRWRLVLALRGGRLGRRCSIAPHVRIESGRGRPIVLGDGVRLLRGVVLSTAAGGRIALEDRVYIGEYGTVRSAAEVRVARDTIIAPHVSIVDFDRRPGAPPPDAFAVQSAIRNPQSAIEAAPVRIGRDVWFGAGVRVLGGVTVADQAVLGAGAVADADVPDRAVAVGAPARVVQYRGEARGRTPPTENPAP